MSKWRRNDFDPHLELCHDGATIMATIPELYFKQEHIAPHMRDLCQHGAGVMIARDPH